MPPLVVALDQDADVSVRKVKLRVLDPVYQADEQRQAVGAFLKRVDDRPAALRGVRWVQPHWRAGPSRPECQTTFPVVHIPADGIGAHPRHVTSDCQQRGCGVCRCIIERTPMRTIVHKAQGWEHERALYAARRIRFARRQKLRRVKDRNGNVVEVEQKVKHVVFSPPQDLAKRLIDPQRAADPKAGVQLMERTLTDKRNKKAKRGSLGYGFDGVAEWFGVKDMHLVFHAERHPSRWNRGTAFEKLTCEPGPHFHALTTNWAKIPRSWLIYNETGWVCKYVGVVDSVYHTLLYLYATASALIREHDVEDQDAGDVHQDAPQRNRRPGRAAQTIDFFVDGGAGAVPPPYPAHERKLRRPNVWSLSPSKAKSTLLYGGLKWFGGWAPNKLRVPDDFDPSGDAVIPCRICGDQVPAKDWMPALRDLATCDKPPDRGPFIVAEGFILEGIRGRRYVMRRLASQARSVPVPVHTEEWI